MKTFKKLTRFIEAQSENFQLRTGSVKVKRTPQVNKILRALFFIAETARADHKPMIIHR